MPTLAQMHAATPKCPHVTARNVQGAGVERTRCGQPCRYNAARNVWRCPAGHGDVYAGEVLGAIANDPYLDLDGLTTFVGDAAIAHVGA